MGICRKCKYLVKKRSLIQNNIELDALIKAKIEQDKRKEESLNNNNKPPLTDVENNESSDNATESPNEDINDNNSSNESNDDTENISTFLENEDIENNENDNEQNNPTEDVTDTTTEDTLDKSDSSDEKEIVIPENACFKFVDRIPRIPILPHPFRIIKERFCPPPLLPMDFEFLCGKDEHIRTENVNGNKFYRPCVIFNRFEECLFFEESGEKEEEIEEDSSVVDSDIEADLDGNFV